MTSTNQRLPSARARASRPSRTSGRGAHERTCVGCGVRASRSDHRLELVRLALVENEVGELTPVVDLGRRGVGRGAWVHPRTRCLEQATRHGLARSARAAVSVELGALERSLVAAAERHAETLVAVGVRARKAVVGTAAVEEAGKRVALLLCAHDASAVEHGALLRELEAGHAHLFGTKQSLGALLGRETVALVGIIDRHLAEGVRQAIAISQSIRERGDPPAIGTV